VTPFRSDGQRCWLAGILLVACDAVSAGPCSTPAVAPVAGIERSTWRETDAQGTGLVRERGTLRRVGLEASSACADNALTLRWTHSDGRRDYDGVSSTGFPVATVTRLSANRFELTALHRLDERVSVGAAISHASIHRSIESTPRAAGYPERFRYWTVAAGARYSRPLTDRTNVSISGWIGAGPAGRLWIDLPRADPTELRMGGNRSLEVQLQLASNPARSERGGWFWSAGLVYRAEILSASEAQAVFAGSSVVGLVTQPRTTQKSVGAFARAGLRF
jgi:hypothetical protein